MLACAGNGSYHQPMKKLAGMLALLLPLTFGWAHGARADQTDPRLDELFVHLQDVDTSRHVLDPNPARTQDGEPGETLFFGASRGK